MLTFFLSLAPFIILTTIKLKVICIKIFQITLKRNDPDPILYADTTIFVYAFYTNNIMNIKQRIVPRVRILPYTDGLLVVMNS